MSGEKTGIKRILDCADTVGESIVWDDRRRALIWIDIIGRRIHRFDPSSLDHRVWPAPDFVTTIGLREDGGTIVGLTQRIALWNFTDEFATFAVPEPDLHDNRLNEGGVAPDSSFWVGTMAANFTQAGEPREQGPAAGRYYRIDGSGAVTCLSADLYGITNTMIWPDRRTFVTADTATNMLYRYVVEPDGKALVRRKPFGTTFDRGLPDGSCLDAEGGIWTCRVAGGACLTRTRPDGTIDRVVDLPCSWPTSCTFGGDDLDTLFVTSARFTMEKAYLDSNPHEGDLFAFNPGIAGTPARRFRLNRAV